MSQDGEGEDEELRAMTREMARGSDAAWQIFHAQFGPKIFRWLLSRTQGDAALADEALQRVYLRIARHVRASASAAEFHSWLWSVACSSAFDTRRSQFRFWKRQAQAAAETDDVVAETFGAEIEGDGKLDAALAALPTESAEILSKKYFAGKSVREIAAEGNVSEKAIESRLTRARQQLREEYLRRQASEVL